MPVLSTYMRMSMSDSESESMAVPNNMVGMDPKGNQNKPNRRACVTVCFLSCDIIGCLRASACKNRESQVK